jgi:SM-20-related protein
VRFPDFLPSGDRQRLLDLVEKNQDNMEELDVTYLGADRKQDGKKDRSIRLQFGVYCETELRAIFDPLLKPLLPQIVADLHTAPFEVGKHTLRLDATPDGGFGRMHQDVGFGARLIYLYYFHTHPKKFTGGDLLIYDQQVNDNLPVHDSFTTLRHMDNSLIIFEPHYFHEVTKVKALENPLNRIDSRLSVCGFVHCAS